MSRILIITLLSLAFSCKLSSQVRVGEWRDHYSYRVATAVAAGPNRIYVASSNGLFWFESATRTIGKLSTVNGLSDVGISTIAHSPFQDLLMIGYENGNIDIMLPNRFHNIPYIRTKLMQGSKRINHFCFVSPTRVLVSTDFGIVDINLQRFEISDTYFIGAGGATLRVSQTAIHNSNIYAATEQGIVGAPVDHPNLIHFASWALGYNHPQGSSDFTGVASFDGVLFAVQATDPATPDILWAYNGSTWDQRWSGYSTIRSIYSSGTKLAVCSPEGIGVLNRASDMLSSRTSYPTINSFYPNHAVFDSQGNLAIADANVGLVIEYGATWSQVYPNGPYTNSAFHISFMGNDVLVAAGARMPNWGNLYNSAGIFIHSQERWSYTYDFTTHDAVLTLPHPQAQNEYFVSAWGHGVLHFRGGEIVARYNQYNTEGALNTITDGAFCRVSGMVFDGSGNLWVSVSGVRNTLAMMQPDGTWKGFPYQNQMGSERLGELVMSPYGHLWLTLAQGGGLFVVDPGQNPANMSSHVSRKVTLTDRDGVLLPNNIFCKAFDRDGYLWVGTTQGVLVSYNPNAILDGNRFYAQQIKVPSRVEGTAVFLLDSETVTAIAVDGGNRKWFGTEKSGVYLYSSDGYTLLKHFNKDNSPLPSNKIQHIGIHPSTGEVFFATERGLVSYRGDASEPKERFGKIYAFPNPIRPGYSGPITITGLVSNTVVKITDSSGNLVFETKSEGGQATWDGRNLNGNRVATGVYLIFCADERGQQSAVGKLLFVK